MPYRIRVLGERNEPLPVQELSRVLTKAVPQTKIVADSEQDWTDLVLQHQGGPEIAHIERNPVIRGELGYEELQEFTEDVSRYKPERAAEWLRAYFQRVKVIIAFQLLSGTDIRDGWNALHELQSAIWTSVGGILQADGEGFSNTDGFHILWQFSDSVQGKWKMAVLNENGGWTPFEMDLGDIKQRNAFWQGRVPSGARLLNV